MALTEQDTKIESKDELLAKFHTPVWKDLEKITREIYSTRTPREVSYAIEKVGFGGNGYFKEIIREDKIGDAERTEFGEFHDACKEKEVDIRGALSEWADMVYVISAALIMNNKESRDQLTSDDFIEINKLINEIENYNHTDIPQEVLDIREKLGKDWRTFLQYLMLAKATVMNDPDNPRNNQEKMSPEDKADWKKNIRDPYEKEKMREFIQENQDGLSEEVKDELKQLWGQR